MKLGTGLFIGVSALVVAMAFQNCAESEFSTLELQSLQHEQRNAPDGGSVDVDGEESPEVPSGPSAPLVPSNPNPSNSTCAAGTVTWAQNGMTCSASHREITSDIQSVTVNDYSAPYIGSVVVYCNNQRATIQEGTQRCSQSVPVANPPAAPNNGPRSLKPHYTPNDPQAIVFSGIVGEADVYVCLEDVQDGSFPCQNGNPNVVFTKQGIYKNTSTNEYAWASLPLMSISGIDFTDYRVHFRKKDSAGAISITAGSVTIGFRLPAEVLLPGLSGRYTSSAGPNVIDYACFGEGGSAPSGYKTYLYSGSNCYYKITY